MSDYLAFDVKILQLIDAGRNTFAALALDMRESAKAFPHTDGDEWRVVDRRLQSLRRKGLIAPKRNGNVSVWHRV